MADANVFKKPCLGNCGMDLYWKQLPDTTRDESRIFDFCPDCAIDASYDAQTAGMIPL